MPTLKVISPPPDAPTEVPVLRENCPAAVPDESPVSSVILPDATPELSSPLLVDKAIEPEPPIAPFPVIRE